jgi:hypothetical protein
MKSPRFVLALLGAVLALAAPVAHAAADGPVFELRTYTATPGKLDTLLARFRDHTVKLFEKHGIVNVGYWVPTDAKDGAGDKLVYLLAHRSRAAAKASFAAFVADPVWKAAQKQSEAGGRIVAKIDSVFLTPTDYTAAMDAGNAAGKARVFELRTYAAAEGKLAGLDARFRDHTVALFAKHGMTNLGYFHPVDADKGAGSTLIYFLAHSSREAAAASWKGFRDDPEWAKARTASEANGKLTSKVTSVFLAPVDFSAIR